MLIYHPKPESDECLIGYLTRVSENLLLNDFGQLLKYLGHNWPNNRAPIQRLLSDREDLHEILSTAGLQYRVPAFKKLFDEHVNEVSSGVIIPRFPRICPQCLMKTGYVKESWAFMPVTVCDIHSVPLLDRPTASAQRLKWLRKECLPEGFTPWLSNLIDTESLAVSSYFKAKLYNQDIQGYEPELLKELTALQALTVLNYISYIIFKSEGGKLFNLKSMPLDRLTNLYNKSWKVILNWPNRFNSILDYFKLRPAKSVSNSITQVYYKDIYDRLRKSRNYPGMDHVYREYLKHINR
jgi:hypothetical protein